MDPSVIGNREKPRGLAKNLLNALTERIRDRQFRPGDKLPSEPELAQQYGVSRTVVREAICGLQAAGLVETRHGSGTFVLERLPKLHLHSKRRDAASVREVFAILELRIALESEAAALAAERRTASQVRALQGILNDFQAAALNEADATEPDFKFHLAIAEATANRYFAETLAQFGNTAILPTPVSLVQSNRERTAYFGSLSREHERIYDAIACGDRRAAAKSMRAHLTAGRDRLREAREKAHSRLAS